MAGMGAKRKEQFWPKGEGPLSGERSRKACLALSTAVDPSRSPVSALTSSGATAINLGLHGCVRAFSRSHRCAAAQRHPERVVLEPPDASRTERNRF
jgi:hypothetical protein